jgi:hypothetical protein
MQREQAETLRQKFAHLDKYLDHMKHLLEKQMQCDIHSIKDELEKFRESNPRSGFSI